MAFMYEPRTTAERDAQNHLYHAYQNTGCEEDEAMAYAKRIFSEQGVQGCYNEACRYEDM